MKDKGSQMRVVVLGLVMGWVGGVWGQPGPVAGPAMPPSIGPTPIRFYSGNLSVGLFQNYWGTGREGHFDAVTPEMIALLQRCSCQAMCDYISWCTVEREAGQWDWSFYRRNAEMLRAAGLQYNVFCWLHFPPKWFLDSDRFVGYENLATGKRIPQLSLWSPETLKIYDEFYGRLAKELGSHIAFLRLAMPSEYGEVGYCTGMTKWLVPQDAAEPGYWCGDRHAVADFRAKSLARYGELAALNRAWGTAFKSADEITMPDVKAGPRGDCDQARTRWLDFVEWYQQSWSDFIERSVAIVRKHFPKQEIIISLGYGGESAFYGNDEGRHVKGMVPLKVAAQTPGAIGYLATRRVSSACRAYDVPYFTEPPGGVNRDQQVLRIWMDASNGTQTWFDYPGNMDGARDLFVKYKPHLTGAPPRCGLALWLPTWHHYLHPNEAWPKSLEATANELRDLCDYEVIDDHMAADGALSKLNIRVFALSGAEALSGASVRAVRDWVQAGGVFITFAGGPMFVREGDAADWQELLGKSPAPAELFETRVQGAVPAAYTFTVTQPDADGYLIGKWFGIDGAGESAIRWCGSGGGLRLPAEAGRAYRVRLRVGVPEAAGTVRIRVGESGLGELRPGQESAEFELPAKLTAGRSYVDLWLEGQNWRPQDVQGTGDTRELLVHVKSVEVRRADAKQGVRAERPPVVQTQWRYRAIWDECGRVLGKGRVLVVPDGDTTGAQKADLIAHFDQHLSEYGPYPAAPLVDGVRDGVWATRFDDHVLYYNAGQQTVAKAVPTAPRRGGPGRAKPTTLPIKPGEIRAVPLGGESK